MVRSRQDFLSTKDGKQILEEEWLKRRAAYLSSEEFQQFLEPFALRLISAGFSGCCAQMEAYLPESSDPEYPTLGKMADSFPEAADLVAEVLEKVPPAVRAKVIPSSSVNQ